MTTKTRFIEACFGRPTDCTPVWLMRQAGRYQPSYRALRAKVGFFELCTTPDLAAQVTVEAVEQLGVDAGIIFSDILVPLVPMGAPVELTDSGPKLASPVRCAADVDRLRAIDSAEAMPYLGESIRLFNDHFAGTVPLIGFAGGPITLAAYLVEGGQSRNFLELKRLLFTAPKTAHRLLDKLARMIAGHLAAQVAAGCHAVQVFDSWVGILGPDDYREFALPYTQRIFDELKRLGVPRILFGTDTAGLLDLIRTVDADVFGLDWRVDLGKAWQRIGHEHPVQGNLDPVCLLMDEDALEQRLAQTLRQAGGRPGHIFNLGHGVLPPTDVDRVRFLVDTVHRLSAREPAGATR